MDPSIMKLLEEDEDETMHSGTDVEAFAAALNRDIERDSSTYQLSNSDPTAFSRGCSDLTNQVLPQWHTSKKYEFSNSLSQGNPNGIQKIEPLSAKEGLVQQAAVPDNQKQMCSSHNEENISSFHHKSNPDSFHPPKFEQNVVAVSQLLKTHDLEINNQGHIRAQNSKHQAQLVRLETANDPQFPLLGMSNQQAVPTTISNQQVTGSSGNQQATTVVNRTLQVPFALLLRFIQPPLNEYQAKQLNTLQIRYKKNEIPKEVFIRHMKDIVGSKIYAAALSQLHSQAVRDAQNVLRQPLSQSQNSIQPQKLPTPASDPILTNANIPASPLNQKVHDSQKKPIPAHQAVNTSQLGSTTQGLKMMPKFDRQDTFSDQKRLPCASLSRMTNNSGGPQNVVYWQSPSTKDQKSGHVKQKPHDQSNQIYKSHFPAPSGLHSFPSAHIENRKANEFEVKSAKMSTTNSTSMLPSNSVSSRIPNQFEPTYVVNSNIPSATPATSSVGIVNNDTGFAKKPTVGQKKPLETLESAPPPSSKKQKVSESVEELNDVTAFSGVDLREEEEQLFSLLKEDTRVSEASRSAVQEEDDMLILEKVPLQQKLMKIVSKCGLKDISSDVERCLSLCVEERMRGLIDNLIRLSKQRLDVEKRSHKTIVNSDVYHHILLMNRRTQDEWEKKEAEADRLQRLNEPEGNPAVEGEKKDDGHVKPIKVPIKLPNNEEDDKFRTTAANVAARAALGGDDMLSKWKLMAEINKQKRASGADAASGSKPGKDMGRKLISLKRDSLEAGKTGQSSDSTSGASGGRNQGHSQSKAARTISVKDVITALEREHQMSNSTLMYRLYEKIGSDAAT